jgi:hypothetical protein
LNRKRRFLFGFILVTLLFILPAANAASVKAFQWLALFLVLYFVGIYEVYRMTIKDIKPKYPIVNPEGHPDIYSGRMPRPIYEDMQRYPWFFKKKSREEKKRRKLDKKPSDKH